MVPRTAPPRPSGLREGVGVGSAMRAAFRVPHHFQHARRLVCCTGGAERGGEVHGGPHGMFAHDDAVAGPPAAPACEQGALEWTLEVRHEIVPQNQSIAGARHILAIEPALHWGGWRRVSRRLHTRVDTSNRVGPVPCPATPSVLRWGGKNAFSRCGTHVRNASARRPAV